MVIQTGLISRVAFSIFGVQIYWYAILITSSIILGFIWAKIHDGRYNIKFENFLDLAIFMIPIAIISARLYYIIFNLDYYMNSPSQIFNIRNGGLAIYGAIIGAVITIIIFCKIKKVNIINLLDYIAPVVPLGQAIGRWGNYINIEAYGRETNLPLKMKILENGIEKYVHPTFLYESIGNFILFLLLIYISKNRKFKGQNVCIYLIGYSFIRFFIEGLRTDSLMLGSIRVSQLLSIIIFVVFVCIYIKNFVIKKRNKLNEK